ncbi:Biofilm-induced protein [Candida albicans P75016]|nr:Biofilm-induced protein [Candida albicans P75016]
MGLFDLLPFPRGGGVADSTTTTIPTYDSTKDSINLQVKSLLYLFKRLKIYQLAPFLNRDNNYELKYIGNTTIDNTNPIHIKLDKIYNLERFLQILIYEDEYKILVDFTKNKFRSLCFMTEYPYGKVLVSMATDSFPQFIDEDEDGDSFENFKFILFPLKNVTIEQMGQLLTKSDIYIEHKNVSTSKRYMIAIESINEVLGFDGNKSDITIFDITITQKNQIIRQYLIKLAIQVQLTRIYQEYIKQHPIVITGDPFVTPPSSPTKKQSNSSISPMKKIPTLRKSMSNLTLNGNTSGVNYNKAPSVPSVPSSPTRLRPQKSMSKLNSKPSISKMKLEELYNPVASPRGKIHQEVKPSSIRSNSSNPINGVGSEDFDNDIDIDIDNKENFRWDVYNKCKLAILEKLKVEKLRIDQKIVV